MTLTITDTRMTSDVTDVTARYSDHAAADGFGAWMLSDQPARLFTRDEAIAAMQQAEQGSMS